jgi:hypothetical protein
MVEGGEELVGRAEEVGEVALWVVVGREEGKVGRCQSH